MGLRKQIITIQLLKSAGNNMDKITNDRRSTGYNSTYPKGGVSCSKDSFVVNQTLVFQIKFYGKIPALRLAAKR